MDAFETLNEAIVRSIMTLGGSKVVGPMIWPAKTPKMAQTALLDALNVNRHEKLDPEQVLFIARLAREKGDLSIINFMLAECCCSPAMPVEPEAELAGLLRANIEARERHAATDARIEKLLVKTLKARAA